MASSELQIAKKLEAFQFARWFRRVVYRLSHGYRTIDELAPSLRFFG
jgi:hypothetical protein